MSLWALHTKAGLLEYPAARLCYNLGDYNYINNNYSARRPPVRQERQMPNVLPLPMMLVQRPVIDCSSLLDPGAPWLNVAGMKAVSVVAKVPAAAAA